MNKRLVKKVIKLGGGPTVLALKLTKVDAKGKTITISRQGVHKWKRIPAAHCIQLETITGISRYEMRPDIFGEDPDYD